MYSSVVCGGPEIKQNWFNSIFASADYPDDWAQGLIYPVHKKGDKSDPQNYRKVFLILSLAKVFESLLENRLSFKNLVCRDDDPLHRSFKKDCRTSDNVCVVQSGWNVKKHVKTALRLLYRFDQSFRLFKQRYTYPETAAAQCRRKISEYKQIYVS